MVETLTALRDPPELLGRIEQADRAELYQALGLTVRYRRIGTTEEVKLTSTLQSVDLKRVGGSETTGNSQLTAPKGVDLKRVGGGTRNNALRPFEARQRVERPTSEGESKAIRCAKSESPTCGCQPRN